MKTHIKTVLFITALAVVLLLGAFATLTIVSSANLPETLPEKPNVAHFRRLKPITVANMLAGYEKVQIVGEEFTRGERSCFTFYGFEYRYRVIGHICCLGDKCQSEVFK